MREFRLSDANHLEIDTVKETPDGSLNGSTRLRDYINGSKPISKPTYEIPDLPPDGISSAVRPSPSRPRGLECPGIASTGPSYSRNTCNGCHARETDTDSSAHPSVAPRALASCRPFDRRHGHDPVDNLLRLRRSRSAGAATDNAATLDCLCQLIIPR
jgi:hypothetical protein